MIIPDECGDYELVEQTTLQVKGNFTSFIIIFLFILTILVYFDRFFF